MYRCDYILPCLMKLIFSLVFASILYSEQVFALESGNCSKQEVMDLAKSGYSKSEIQEMCIVTLENPKCCCSETGFIIAPQRKQTTHNFSWMRADRCSTRPYGVMQEMQRYCVENYRCGR